MLGATASRWCRAGELRCHKRLLNRIMRTQTANSYPIARVITETRTKLLCFLHSSSKSDFHGSPVLRSGGTLNLISSRRTTTRLGPRTNLFTHLNAFLSDSSSKPVSQSILIISSLFFPLYFILNMVIFEFFCKCLRTTGFEH